MRVRLLRRLGMMRRRRLRGSNKRWRMRVRLLRRP
jgi:hypothetical protein